MKYLRAKRAWRQRKPDIFQYVTPIVVGGETVGYSNLVGSVNEYTEVFIQWLQDEPRLFRGSR